MIFMGKRPLVLLLLLLLVLEMTAFFDDEQEWENEDDFPRWLRFQSIR